MGGRRKKENWKGKKGAKELGDRTRKRKGELKNFQKFYCGKYIYIYIITLYTPN